MATKTTDSLPHSPKEWLKAAKSQEVDNVFPDGLSVYNSASDLLWKQYLLLRVYWQEFNVKDLVVEYFLGEGYYKEASDIFGDHKEWKQYLEGLSNFRKGIAGLPRQSIGMFNNTLRSQVLCLPKLEEEAVTGDDDRSSNIRPQPELVKMIKVDSQHSPSKTRSPEAEYAKAQGGFSPANVGRRRRVPVARPEMLSSSMIPDVGSSSDDKLSSGREDVDPSYQPDTKKRKNLKTSDEQMVNMALCNFTLTLLELLPARLLYSSAERRTFRFAKLWTAQTDGIIFSSINDNEVHAIFECKRSMRKDILKSVRQQEAGEMACWIYSQDSSGDIGRMSTDIIKQGPEKGHARHKRLLIAQDCDELYIIIGEYASSYVNYIRCTGDPNGHTFLRMLEFGPFRIKEQEEMQILALFLLAFFRRQEARMEARKLERKGTSTDTKGDPVHRGRSSTAKDGDKTSSRNPSKGAEHHRSSSRSALSSVHDRPRSRPDTPEPMQRLPAVEQRSMRPTRSASGQLVRPAQASRSHGRPREARDTSHWESSAQHSKSWEPKTPLSRRGNDLPLIADLPMAASPTEFEPLDDPSLSTRSTFSLFGHVRGHREASQERQQDGLNEATRPVEAASGRPKTLPDRTRTQRSSIRTLPPVQPDLSGVEQSSRRHPTRRQKDDIQPQ